MNSNADVKVTYGARLAELRQAENLSKEAIAKRLRIAKSIIADIEEGQIECIPVVFLRGYIKSYAKLVDLPQKELSDYLNQIEMVNNNLTTIKHYSQTGKGKHHGKRITICIFVLLLTLLGSTAFFLWREYSSSQNNPTWLNPSQATQTEWSTNN